MACVVGLYNGTTNSVIKPDFEYAVHNYNDANGCDLWEEIRGIHFFTIAAHHRALYEAATSPTSTATLNAGSGLVQSSLNGRLLDAAIPLGVGLFASQDDSILASIFQLESGFINEYSLNQKTTVNVASTRCRRGTTTDASSCRTRSVLSDEVLESVCDGYKMKIDVRIPHPRELLHRRSPPFTSSTQRINFVIQNTGCMSMTNGTSMAAVSMAAHSSSSSVLGSIAGRDGRACRVRMINEDLVERAVLLKRNWKPLAHSEKMIVVGAPKAVV